MKRITNYALNCLIEQGISKEHIKSLIKAIENQTRDNILTPEQAIEILLDGKRYLCMTYPLVWIDAAFCWENSPEGMIFWSNIFDQVLIELINQQLYE